MSSRKVAHHQIIRSIAAAALILPLAACAAPPVADQAPAARQQLAAPETPRLEPAAGPVPAPVPVQVPVPAPASADIQPLPRGATTAGRPATPARPAPSGPISTPVQAPRSAAAVPAGTAAEPAPAAGSTTATTSPATTPAPVATPAPGQRPPQVVMPGSATPSAGSLLQTILALVLVLALLLGLAWVMKRFGPRAMGASANVRLVGALNIGGRERIMVVEVGNQWIVVGASPGRVNALATMPRQDGAQGQDEQLAMQGATAGATAGANPAPPAASFGEWLKKTIDKRNAT